MSPPQEGIDRQTLREQRASECRLFARLIPDRPMADASGARRGGALQVPRAAMRCVQPGIASRLRQAATRPAPLRRRAPVGNRRRVFANVRHVPCVISRPAEAGEAYLRASAPRWCRTAPAPHGVGVCFAPAHPAMVESFKRRRFWPSSERPTSPSPAIRCRL